ncbi:MAG: glycoside hydrolase family 97 N-terminal domain-containing protein [Verrucomicrobiia bacterium]
MASPNGAIRASVMLDQSHGTASYRVSSRGITVIENSPLGITTSVGDFTRGLVFASNAVQEINETYVLPVGKRSTYVNHANELVLTFHPRSRHRPASAVAIPVLSGTRLRSQTGRG